MPGRTESTVREISTFLTRQVDAPYVLLRTDWCKMNRTGRLAMRWIHGLGKAIGKEFC